MPNNPSYAINDASHLEKIGFPEFTTKLITDVFDALVSSNIRQTESYIELLKETSKTLTQFVNDTKEDINGEMVLEFLARVMPVTSVDKKNEVLLQDTKNKDNVILNSAEAAALTNAVRVPGLEVEGSPEQKFTDGSVKRDLILEAVAKRIAATNHELLKEMVKQGMMRLVVENGQIETRLTFNTSSNITDRESTSSYNSSSYSKSRSGGTGRFISLWAKASSSTKRNTLSVTTANTSNVSSSSTSINIFGGVKLNFKTDYMSLDR